MLSFQYLLQVNCCLTIFWLVYHFILRETTFFKLNRTYLIISILLSFAFPVIEFKTDIAPIQLLSAQLPEVIVSSNFTNTVSNTYNWFLVFYVIGSLLVLGAFIAEIVKISLLKSNSRSENNGKYAIFYTKENLPTFSFGKSIFVPENWQISANEQQQILKHEQAHIRQKHTWDIVFIQLVKMVIWFNPFVYLYEKAIKNNHEFLADEATLKTINKYAYAYSLVANVRMQNQYNLTHKFSNKSQLKQRIMMISKQKTNRLELSRYLSFLLACVVLFSIFSCTEEITSNANDKSYSIYETEDDVFTIVEIMPEYPDGQMKMLEYLGANIQYPATSRDAGVEGRNVVAFIVEKDGSITNAKIVRSLDEATDAESLRVVNAMPNWIPGKQKGENVRVAFNLPIRYKLE